MKEAKKIVLSFLSLFSLTLISAYSSDYGLGFNSFFSSLGDYFPFMIIFLAVFYIFNLILKKVIPRNGWLIALLVSIFTLYGLTKIQVDFLGIFYSLGMSEDFFFKIAPWIVLAFAVVTLWTGNFGKLLMIFGIILIILGITKIAEQHVAAIVIGTILFLIGLWINKKISIKLPRFSRFSGGVGQIPRNPNGANKLIKEAKIFKSKCKNKFENSWTKYISHLKTRGYGKSELEIAKNMGVNPKEIVNIFNRYGLIK